MHEVLIMMDVRNALFWEATGSDRCLNVLE
jgi:hypothetical protein